MSTIIGKEKISTDETQKSETKQTYYSTGAVVAIGVLGITGYYIYQFNTPKETKVNQTNKAMVHQCKENPDKFNMD